MIGYVPHLWREGKGPFISSVCIHRDVGKCESSAQCPGPKTYLHISIVRAETSWLCPSKDDWTGLSIPTGQINPSKQICSNSCQSKRQTYQLGSETSPRAPWGKGLPGGYPQHRILPWRGAEGRVDSGSDGSATGKMKPALCDLEIRVILVNP